MFVLGVVPLALVFAIDLGTGPAGRWIGAAIAIGISTAVGGRFSSPSQMD